MERLLADAEKLSGVEYNIDNLGDVYSAIHVIQENLGLTGVAAEEAQTTFSGSMGAMKAAATNLMANLTLGEDIGPSLDTLSQTVKTFLFGNLIPMFGNMAQALPQLITGFADMFGDMSTMIKSNSDEIISLGLEIVTSIASAIIEAAPELANTAFSLVRALGRQLIEADWASIGQELLTTLGATIAEFSTTLSEENYMNINFLSSLESFLSGAVEGGIQLVTGVVNGIVQALPGLITTAGSLASEFITYLRQGFTTGLPNILSSASEIITTIVTGILEAIPELITVAGQLATDFVGFVLENAPIIMESGVDLLLNLVQGVQDSLPEIVASAKEAISSFLTTILDNLPDVVLQGIELLSSLISGIIEALPDLVLAAGDIILSVVDTLAQYDWLAIGSDILQGIINGLLGMIDSLVDAVKELASAIWDNILDFFDIGSPSKLAAWAGEMIDLGWAGGITDNADVVNDAISDLNQEAADQLQMSSDIGDVDATVSGSDSKIDRLLALMEEYLPQLADAQRVVLEGDAEGLFNVVRAQNKVYTRMNGESAFA